MYYYKLFTLYEDKMDIDQNHYSTDFENGAIDVDEPSEAELEDHCKKVTKRRAAYESNNATQQGLIELGKHIFAKENSKQKRATRHLYLIKSVRDSDYFLSERFLNEVDDCDDDLVKNIAKKLATFASMFRELYSHNVEDISDLNKEIESLKMENADMGEMVDKYIEEVDTEEAKLAKVATELTRYKGMFAVHEEKLAEYHTVMTRQKKTISMLTADNQIYADCVCSHQGEKKDWDDKKVALDKIVLIQQKTIEQLKKNAQYFTGNCAYFSIGCVIAVIGSAMYSMAYENSPLCALIGLIKH